jgi:hypothetical protein
MHVNTYIGTTYWIDVIKLLNLLYYIYSDITMGFNLYIYIILAETTAMKIVEPYNIFMTGYELIN